MQWDRGRQDTGYFKKKVFDSLFKHPFKKDGVAGCDLYLLKFPEKSYLPKHKDEVTFGRHFRFNLILKPAKEGGKFFCEKSIIDWPFLKVFNPDANEHSLSEVTKGTRYVLSFGFVI